MAEISVYGNLIQKETKEQHGASDGTFDVNISWAYIDNQEFYIMNGVDKGEMTFVCRREIVRDFMRFMRKTTKIEVVSKNAMFNGTYHLCELFEWFKLNDPITTTITCRCLQKAIVDELVKNKYELVWTEYCIDLNGNIRPTDWALVQKELLQDIKYKNQVQYQSENITPVDAWKSKSYALTFPFIYDDMTCPTLVMGESYRLVLQDRSLGQYVDEILFDVANTTKNGCSLTAIVFPSGEMYIPNACRATSMTHICKKLGSDKFTLYKISRVHANYTSKIIRVEMSGPQMDAQTFNKLATGTVRIDFESSGPVGLYISPSNKMNRALEETFEYNKE